MTRLRRQILFGVKLSLALGLLALLLFGKTDWREVADVFRGSRPSWIPAFVGVQIALTWVSCYKWGLFVRGQGGQVSQLRLFGLYLVGMFFNNFLPGSVGGDGVRSYLLGRRIESQGRALAGVFMERFTGFVAMVTLAAAAFLFSPALRAESLVVAAVVGMTAACAAVIIVLLKPEILMWSKFPFGKSGLASRAKTKASLFRDYVLEFKGRHRLLALAMLASYVFYFFGALNVWVAGQVLGVELGFAHLLVVTPIIMLLASIPLTPNNIGVWEWAFSIFLVSAGATTAEGLSIALAIRAQTLVSSLFGGLIFLGERSDAEVRSDVDAPHVLFSGRGHADATLGLKKGSRG